VKHSSTADGEDMTTARRDPSLRENMGPCFSEREWSVRWIGCLRRWRWPTIGRAKGLGGRLLILPCFLLWSKNLVERARNTKHGIRRE